MTVVPATPPPVTRKTVMCSPPVPETATSRLARAKVVWVRAVAPVAGHSVGQDLAGRRGSGRTPNRPRSSLHRERAGFIVTISRDRLLHNRERDDCDMREREAACREQRKRSLVSVADGGKQIKPSTLPRGLNRLLFTLQHLPSCRHFQRG